METVVEGAFVENIPGEPAITTRDYGKCYGSCNSEIETNIITHRVVEQNWRQSLWKCMKISFEATVCCGVLGSLVGILLWWLELNFKAYCFAIWNEIPESIHQRNLIADIFIAALTHFWVLSCIAPLCGWSTIKKLHLIYICAIGSLLDGINRSLLYFLFHEYSKRWKHYIGNVIFIVTSFAVCYRFARHCKAAHNAHCNVFLLTLKLTLQFIIGFLIFIPFNLVFLDLYYNSSHIEKTVLVCALTIAYAIPKLFISHVVTNLREVCTPGDEMVLVVAYMTATTICARLMQANVETLSFFIIVSVVHGLLNVIDKLSLPLRRRILTCVCCGSMENCNRQSVSASVFLANQSLFSITTETTSVIFGIIAAYLLIYYYKKENGTRRSHSGYVLFIGIMKRCSIAVGIELIFNVIAVKVQTYLYQIPVIGAWQGKWKSIIIIHVIQVTFIVLYSSEYFDRILLKDYHKKTNVTCFGSFKRV